MAPRGAWSLRCDRAELSRGCRPLLRTSGGHAAERRRHDRHRRYRSGGARARRLGPPDETRLCAASEGVLLVRRDARLVSSGPRRRHRGAPVHGRRDRAEGTAARGCRAPAGVGWGRPPGRQARSGDPDAVHRVWASDRRGRRAAAGRSGRHASGPLPQTGPDPSMAAVAGRRPRHPALHQGGAAVRLRAQSLLHDARADPAARPKSPGQDGPRPAGGHRRRHRPTRAPRPSACRGPAPPGSGHVDEGDRGLPRPPRSVVHHDLRQGRPRRASRGGRSRPGGPGMILREVIERYVLWRRAHGAKFTTGASLLRRFLDHADGDAACDAVTTAQVLAYLAGEGPPTRHRENRYYALAGFWRHAISRGHAARSPMPDDAPRSPVRAPPYIYSRDELARLFDPATVEASRRGAVQLDAVTFRTLLLLLY